MIQSQGVTGCLGQRIKIDLWAGMTVTKVKLLLGSIKGAIARLHKIGKIRQAVGQEGKYVPTPRASIAYM